MRRTQLLILAMLVALAMAPSVWAQGSSTLTGTVYDQTGAVIPGASVTATNKPTGVDYTTQTTAAGLYRLPSLPVGTYSISIGAKGFRQAVIDNVVLTVAQTVTQNATLKLGVETQTVTVEGEGEQLVQTASSQISGLVDRNTLASLPLEIRDPSSFVNLLPGSVPSAIGNVEFNGSTRGSAVNGARGGTGNFLLDGFDNNDQGQGGRSHNTVGSIPGAMTGVSPDAVQEFRVITNDFEAQYGRHAGFVAEYVVKSGTNSLHGSAFEYNRNQAITAQDFFSNKFGVKDALVRNQFGGSLGGPIRRDKTFFFGSVELQRLRQNAPNVVTSVTPDFINFVNSGAFADFNETDPNGLCMQATGATCPGAFSNSRTLGPIAQDLLNRFPMPVPTSDFSNRGAGIWPALGVATNYPVNIFGDTDVRNKTQFNENRFTVKLDQNFSERDRLSGMMSFDDFDDFESSLGGDFAGSPYFPFVGPSRAQNWGLTYTHVFSPTIVDQAKISYLRHNTLFPRAVAPDVPSIVTAFDPLGVGFGMSSSLPQGGTDNQFQYQNQVAITRGRHSFKVGAEYRRTRNGSVFDANVNGLYLPYDTENLLTDGWFGSNADQAIFGGDHLGSFYYAQAAVDPVTGTTPDSYRGFRGNEFGAFIQDDWKLLPRLTLNLGLRWDYYGPPHNYVPGFDSNFYFGSGITPVATATDNPFFPVDNAAYAREATAVFVQKDSNIWNKDTNNFGPRFGFAWDVRGNQKTVIRGGGGVFYDRIWNNLFENIRFNPPRYSFNTIGAFINGDPVSPTATPDLYSIPVDTALFANPAFAGSVSPRHMDENLVAPYMEQASFGIQHQVTPSMVVEADYVGTFGHKLIGVVDLNTFPGRIVTDANGNSLYSDARPNTSISRDNARGNFYNSNYHALQVRVEKRMSHGLQLQSNYTWSKTLDYVSDAFNNRQGNDIYPLDTLNRALDYGLADFDLRHRWVTSFLYDLPFARSNRWIGGWTAGSIITLQSGLPFALYDSGSDANGDGNTIDRPDFVGTGSIQSVINNSASPANGYFLIQDAQGNPLFVDAQMNPSVNNGLWADGSVGRNVLTGPGLASVDFSLAKKFRLTEKAAFQLQFNFFNMFNRANFGLPVGNLSSSQFGRSTDTYGPRVGQFAARLDF
jgi:hypothetical protein